MDPLLCPKPAEPTFLHQRLFVITGEHEIAAKHRVPPKCLLCVTSLPGSGSGQEGLPAAVGMSEVGGTDGWM